MSQEKMDFIREKHKGQLDKSGQDYFTAHLVPVGSWFNEDLRYAAMAHDILEDTDATYLEMMNHGFTVHEVYLVALLTKNETDDYTTYLKRIRNNNEARRIKIADIVSNLSRVALLDDKTRFRLVGKYHHALLVLMGEI
jgi:(p)ppGpp synthase/HD superfamily hydrolase